MLLNVPKTKLSITSMIHLQYFSPLHATAPADLDRELQRLLHYGRPYPFFLNDGCTCQDPEETQNFNL